MDELEKFRSTVERFVEHSELSPSRFGLLAAGDPNFVADLRSGREPRSALRRRVLQWIAENDATADNPPAAA